MGLTKQDFDYSWADGGSGHGVSTIFTDTEGCGYISSGATISMTKCDVSEGYICEHPNGKETVKTMDCDQHILLMIIKQINQ